MVSLKDLDLVKRHNWNAGHGGRYLTRTRWRRRVTLQVAIMRPKRGYFVDLVSGDPLDCRRSNLRICKWSDSSKNRRGTGKSLSGFKGVHVTSRPGVWEAKITSDGKTYHLGKYKDVIAAAKAYNAAAVRYHGKFARLNVIP